MSSPTPEKIEIARIPTPIQKLDRLSEHLGGPAIYVKRDDLTGSALSGNKVRKLEYSFAEAQRQGADAVVTCGGIQSNHCRATAVVAAKLGMECTLVLRGTEPEIPSGNLLLDWLAGASVRWVTPDEYREREALFEEIVSEMKNRGKTPYVIPEGASNSIGAFGYAGAAREIRDQAASMGVEFAAIAHAVGSGGTTAGLLLGQAIHGTDIPVLAFAVCDDEEFFNNRVGEIIDGCRRNYGVEETPDLALLKVDDGYIGSGYAVPYAEVIETIRLFAGLEGIFLDPVYTGKAAWGMIDNVKKGRWEKKDNVLFIHTGGIYGLLAQNETVYRGAS